jgi:hypothetical protein
MDIASTLERCERALKSDNDIDLSSLGFWTAVSAAKRDPRLADEYGARIASIDEVAFHRWVRLALPAWLGAAAMTLLTAAGLGVVSAAYFLESPWNGLAILMGTGLLLGGTHTLAHLIVGSLVGIKFTHWFIGRRPQPGVKVDYASYLRTSPKARAWMHASGALVTKLVPFVNLGAAWGSHSPAWTWWALIGLGILMIVSDLMLSVKSSDWKRFRREMRYAR